MKPPIKKLFPSCNDEVPPAFNKSLVSHSMNSSPLNLEDQLGPPEIKKNIFVKLSHEIALVIMPETFLALCCVSET